MQVSQIEDLLLEAPELSDLQKRILIIRFCGVIKHYRGRVLLVSYLFNIMRFIVTVGSLLVPALLSIQSPGSVSSVTSPDTIYWSTWAVSLAVTMSNGILALFKIDKKYLTSFLLAKNAGHNNSITNWIVSDSGTDFNIAVSLIRFIIFIRVFCFQDINCLPWLIDVKIVHNKSSSFICI